MVYTCDWMLWRSTAALAAAARGGAVRSAGSEGTMLLLLLGKRDMAARGNVFGQSGRAGQHTGAC